MIRAHGTYRQIRQVLAYRQIKPGYGTMAFEHWPNDMIWCSESIDYQWRHGNLTEEQLEELTDEVCRLHDYEEV